MLAPNTLLQNRYLIIRSIGQGGMGAVYLAKDQRLGNTVALKESFFSDVRMRKAFEREARLLAHLRHSALPKVIDHFDEGDGQFLVMEFISGDDLEVLLAQRGRPFPPDQVLHWADQLLDALDYLHTQESPILHRDIKPANLKLASRDQIILLDFGLAKGAAGEMSSVATSGSVFGFTQNFAPLEQIHGKGTDVRSDLYSLGATLYYLMTGVLPPDAVSRATAKIAEQADPVLPANEVNPEITSHIASCLAQAMALGHALRPESAAAMRKALKQANPSTMVAETIDLSEPTPAAERTTLRVPDARLEARSNMPLTVPGPVFSQQKPQATMATPDFLLKKPARAASPTLPSERSRQFRWLPWLIGSVLALLVVGISIAFFVTRKRPLTPTPKDVTGVAATVNDQPIMLSEVERLIREQSKGVNLSDLELRQARLQVLDTLIQREALFQRAGREGLAPTEEQVTDSINEQKKQSGMTDEEFSKQLNAQNLTANQLREEARRDLAIKALQEKNAGKISISDREVEDYFNANKEKLVDARGVGLAMIVVDPADNSAAGITNDAKGDAEAKAKINRIYQQLKDGSDFGTVARAESEDAKGVVRGGDIGFATEDDLKQSGFPRQLIDQFFGPMSVGSFTAPARFNSPNFPEGRWYIFKLGERRTQNRNLILSSPGVREGITKALLQQRKEILNAELLITATNEAKVVNYLAANKTTN